MKINPYLLFDGNCRQAMAFYEKALGAKIETISTWGEGPAADQMPKEAHDLVMHASLNLNDQRIMASDNPPGDKYEGYKGFNITINVDKPEDAEQIFGAISEGGQITMPIEETFWALRFGMVTDQFGVPWMVNCDNPEVPQS